MAGTMPHAIFIETDVDGAGLVGAYAASVVLAVLAMATLLAMNLFKPKETH